MPFKSVEERRQYQNKYYHDRWQWYRDLKENNPCSDCGQFYPYYVMQYDHREGKKLVVSDLRTYSRERAEAEIAKCDLVCANCHAVRTQRRMFPESFLSSTTEVQDGPNV